METVNQALHPVQAERAERQAPRDAYQALQNRLHALRYERELRDEPWNPDRHTPLDRWAIARHNAQADISIYTARLQHTGLGHRRPVRRLLNEAQERLATAQAGWHEVYDTDVARLDPLIQQAQRKLEHAVRLEPVGDHDRDLDPQIRDLHLEVNLGNADRPTLDSLRTAHHHLSLGAPKATSTTSSRASTPNSRLELFSDEPRSPTSSLRNRSAPSVVSMALNWTFRTNTLQDGVR